MRHITWIKLRQTEKFQWWRLPCWWLINPLLVLCFVPYCLPGMTVDRLGNYAVIFIVPVIIAAILRGRRGGLIASGVVAIGLAAVNVRDYGAHVPTLGIYSYLLGNVAIVTFGLVTGQFSFLNRKLAASHHDLEAAYRHIEHQALTDPLTGLPNHRALMAQLLTQLAHAQQAQRPVSLLFFDADHFKQVNDTYGHAIGDVVLQTLGQRAQQSLGDDAFVGRYGGEEFVALLPNLIGDAAMACADHLRQAIAATTVAAEHVTGGIACTVSIGLASYPEHGTDGTALLQQADQAMYAAKQQGRNRVLRAAPELLTAVMVPEASQDVSALRDMAHALIAALSAHDAATAAHSERVAHLVRRIALELQLPDSDAALLEIAALLHDVGKLAISPLLLHKAGPLSEEEWTVMRRHPQQGAAIMHTVPIFGSIEATIRAHHERWDGHGYPDGLAGEDIPFGARLITVADSYDTMCEQRAYKLPFTSAQALDEVQRCSGKQFDPAIVEACVQVIMSNERQAAAA